VTAFNSESSQPFQEHGPITVINKHRVRGPPPVQLLQCDKCCKCTEKKYKQVKITFYNTTCPIQSTRRLGLFLLESIQIRGSIHDKLQTKSSSTLSVLPHFASWQQESPACPKMPSVTAYCAQSGRSRGNFHVAIISTT